MTIKFKTSMVAENWVLGPNLVSHVCFPFKILPETNFWFRAVFASLNLLKAQVCHTFFYSGCSWSPESRECTGCRGRGLGGLPVAVSPFGEVCIIVCKVLCVQNLMFSSVTGNNHIIFKCRYG